MRKKVMKKSLWIKLKRKKRLNQLKNQDKNLNKI